MENVINTHVGHMVKAVIDARGVAYAHFAKEMQLHRSSTTQLAAIMHRVQWHWVKTILEESLQRFAKHTV